MKSFRLGLRGRIALGFVVVIALGFGMAGYGVLGLSRMSKSVAGMNATASTVVMVQEVTRQLEIMRRGTNRFSQDGNPQALEDIIHGEAKAGELLTQIVAAFASDEQHQIATRVLQDLASFVTQREKFTRTARLVFAERTKLITGGTTLTTVTRRLLQAAQSTEDEDLTVTAVEVDSAILQVRVESWRFLATLDPNGPATFAVDHAKALAILENLLKISDDHVRQRAQSVQAALTDYGNGFDITAKNLLENKALYENVMTPLLQGMQADMDVALDSLRSDFAADVTGSQTTADRTIWLQAIAALATALLGAVLAALIGWAIVKPIATMTTAMTRLAEGEQDIDIPARDATDEMGAMARAVDVFRLAAIENDRLTAEQAREQAARGRRQAAMDRHTQDFGTSISGVMNGLIDSASRMRTAVSQMGAATKTTRDSTSSSDLNSIAVATEEMAASISEISRQVAMVTTAVQQAVERASETDSKVTELAGAADRIGDVVRLINDIAGKTNLLALNATIEAARAGEAGKGFAVVASEVKSLATQTAQATGRIQTQIVSIRSATNEAVEAVRVVGAAISQVDSVASAIAAAVEEQAAATQGISNSIQTVSAATQAAAQAMDQVLAMAEQTDDASHSVRIAADEVGQTAETLQTEVGDFLSAMSQEDNGERRSYERIAGTGAHATVKVGRENEVDAEVRDISRGGAALACPTSAAPGTEVQIGLPAGVKVRGRIVRSEHGVIAVAFRQDAATVAQIERAMELLSRQTLPRAA